MVMIDEEYHGASCYQCNMTGTTLHDSTNQSFLILQRRYSGLWL
jgi:hypothetical protein